MTSRRSRGDGGLYWLEGRQRWIASVTVGYTPKGKRIVKSASGRTKTEAKNKLREIVRDAEDGFALTGEGYTVRQAVEDWLAYGLAGRSPSTLENRRILATTHVIRPLGARKLRELSAEDVDRWLADRAKVLSTSTLQRVKSILRRAIGRAQARDRVRRNVVMLCDTPTGRGGRPSKSLTLSQAQAVLAAAEASPLRAYLVVALLTGARTEELRALTWKHVVLAAMRTQIPQCSRTSWCGARSARPATLKHRSLGDHWLSPSAVSRLFGRTVLLRSGRGSSPGNAGRRQTWFSLRWLGRP